MNRSKNRKHTRAFALAASLFAFSIPALAQNDGATVYKSKCAGCHSPDGSGSGPAGKAMHLRDLRSPDVQKQTDADLIAITANGKGSMPGYKGKLTDDQIKQVVSFIRDLAKKG
ncbi:MAG TPA: c-type cytochrome [Candidatus Acidoferrales bacterium]|nr:c-type cytochrome [Candidatus Acidoferrales bacterium]